MDQDTSIQTAPSGARSVRRAPEGAKFGVVRDPEVLATAKRRKFTREYKLKVLEEYDRYPMGQKGLLLRKEGLFYSSLTSWRKELDKMDKSNSRKINNNKDLHNKNAKLLRENKRLKLKLAKAEGLIEIQKKISEMLKLDENQNEES